MSITVYGAKAFTDVLKGKIRDIRVTWLLEELDLPYSRVVLDPMKGENKTPEYLRLNPTGKVPTLVDGDFALFESAAICEYLATKYERFIPPHDTDDYYLCKQWSYFVLTNVEPQCSRIFAADYFYEQNQCTTEIRNLAIEIIPRFFGVLNQQLSAQSFLTGDDFTIADIFLNTCLASISHTNILSDYPAIKKYTESCSARPAFMRAYRQNGVL